jgi:shikimate kinase
LALAIVLVLFFVLISFIGLMGSGKTTVGRSLARRLQLGFYDSDHVIEEKLGYSLRTFFEQEGEDRFRDLEQATLESLTLKNNAVLSTGGGACIRLANREHLNTRSHVIYLKASPDELYRRIRQDGTRPLLQVADPLAKLHELYTARHPLYLETAHVTFETSRPSMNFLVNQITKHLEVSGVI